LPTDTGLLTKVKDGDLAMEFSNFYVTLKRQSIATSKSKGRHSPMTETGLIGVKDGVHTLELAQESQPPSSGKEANALNVDFTSTWMMRLKFITPMEIIAIPKWRI